MFDMKKSERKNSLNKQKGLGMMEIVITILVMTIGLFGMVTMQLTTLKNATIANQRYLASDLAYEISERMRANPSDLASYKNLPTSKVTKDCSDIVKSQCSIVEEDMFWLKNSMKNIKQVLPNGEVVITEISSNPQIFRATVSWTEMNPTLSAAAVAKGSANTVTRSYVYEFQI